jgi:hypothetical protein
VVETRSRRAHNGPRSSLGSGLNRGAGQASPLRDRLASRLTEAWSQVPTRIP